MRKYNFPVYIQLIIFLFYNSFLIFLIALITLNQQRIKKKIHFDVLLLYMISFAGSFMLITNVCTCLNFNAMPIILVAEMLLIIYFSSRIRLIGLTGYLNRVLQIFILGGICCGKSTVSEIFQNDLKLSIIDCDQLARKVVEVGKPAYNKIVKYFGKDILLENKEINREKLGKIVFQDKAKLKMLNSFQHFEIFKEILKQIFITFFKNQKQIAVLECPLLFESWLNWICSPNVVVFIPSEEIQVERLMKRDKISEEEALQKIKAQSPQSYRIRKADVLINNGLSKNNLKLECTEKIAMYLL